MKISVTSKNSKQDKLFQNKMVMVNGHEVGTLGLAATTSTCFTFFSKCPTSKKFDGMTFDSVIEFKNFFK